MTKLLFSCHPRNQVLIYHVYFSYSLNTMRAFNRSEPTRTVALDISKAFDRVWHAGLLYKFKSYVISCHIIGLICSFLGNRWFRMVLDGKSSQEYPVNAGVIKAPFLLLHFSYYTLMTFLMMFSVLLLSMLMILLSILIVIRHLICGDNLNWLLNLNLIYETLWTWVRSGLLISMLGKISWFHLNGLTTLVLLMWKWMGLFLMKNHLLGCWGWPSLLKWIGALTLSPLLKLLSRKMEPQFALWSFFLLRLLCISINLSYAHVWNTVVNFSCGRSTHYSDRLHDFSVTIPRCYNNVYVNSFFPHIARLWNSLPIEYFPLTYNLNSFKSIEVTDTYQM